MTRETFDDVVDRIAGEMTAAADDPTFGSRLRARLDEPRAPRYGRHAGAIAAAALALAVAMGPVVFRNVEQAPADVPTPALASRETQMPAHRLQQPAPRPLRAAASADTGRKTDRPATAAGPAVELLSGPASLSVADLHIEPLIVPPVGLSDLGVAELTVTGLAIAEEQ